MFGSCAMPRTGQRDGTRKLQHLGDQNCWKARVFMADLAADFEANLLASLVNLGFSDGLCGGCFC